MLFSQKKSKPSACVGACCCDRSHGEDIALPLRRLGGDLPFGIAKREQVVAEAVIKTAKETGVARI